MPLELLYRDDVFACGNLGPVFVTYVFGPWSGAQVRVVAALEDRLVKTLGKLSPLAILSRTDTAKGARSEVNHESMELIERFEEHLVGCAVVIRTPGIQGMVTRTIVSGLLFFGRRKAPFKIFAEVDDAVPWLQKLPGQDAATSAHAKLLDEVRQFVRTHTPPELAAADAARAG